MGTRKSYVYALLNPRAPGKVNPPFWPGAQEFGVRAALSASTYLQVFYLRYHLEGDRPAEKVMGRVTEVNRNGRSTSFEGQFAKARRAGNRLRRRIQLAIAARAVKVASKSNHTHG